MNNTIYHFLLFICPHNEYIKYFSTWLLFQKHGTTSKVPKPTRLDQEEQAKLAKSGLDMKMISSEVKVDFKKIFSSHIKV